MIIAGTGHRPNKLGGYGYVVKEKLVTLAVNWLRQQQPSKVISGGALGWDQALAAGALYTNIPLVMALPFEGFERKWPKESQDFLHDLASHSELVYVCEPGYAPWKMQKRNEWMVDNADTLLALWNGTPGGTGNCIDYAQRRGIEIVNLWEKYSGKEPVEEGPQRTGDAERI